MTTSFRIGRRALLASGVAIAATAGLVRPSFAAAKVIRISTPGTDSEWQSKALEAFKQALERGHARRLRRADPL